MKIRYGFVSNSSSSSFILGLRNELDEKSIESIFKTENPLLCGIAKHIAQAFLRSSESFSKEDIMESFYIKDESDLPDIYIKAFNLAKNNNFKLYSGSFTNQDGGLEEFLCDLDINYED